MADSRLAYFLHIKLTDVMGYKIPFATEFIKNGLAARIKKIPMQSSDGVLCLKEIE